MKQPYCRYCGKAIRKRTTTVYFVNTQEEKERQDRVSSYSKHVVGAPMTRAEAQLLVGNERIVSHRKRGTIIDGDRIDRVTTWDGESYESQFFCTGDHAQRFAYAVLRTEKYADLAMPAYRKVTGT
ncbi:MAG: hypothetical protein J0I99_00530 [Devosia sp.]|uniref:hypothetical protein n=1 Tax=Devosia sp. TaxID=1871048 RepID=UPI001ACE4DA0|nr:hypothetical protein [Devosia sp.]MBN9310849.1 hypothetical protein [Devosia sp.]MBN9314202.1 hypothetical protein [Devosia sp.]